MRNDVTVIYYTSSREKSEFEAKIRQKLLDVMGDLPLISVSQRPLIGFGKNICVGEQPFCDATAHRQLLIGLQEAKTPFVLAAESDCLYPPEYFTFVPTELDKAYRYGDVRILFSWIGPNTQGKFWKKPYCEGAQMCGREYWIKAIEYALRKVHGWEKRRPGIVFNSGLQYSWVSENAVISCKTTDALRKFAGVTKESSDELPYWGSAESLRKELFNN